MTATYVDTNVLVYAFGDKEHPLRTAARRALYDAADHGLLFTSTLTLDEFIWARRKSSDNKTAIADTRVLVRSSVIQYTDVRLTHVLAALDHIEGHGLRPRDAIHLAVCQGAACRRILSDDPDFDAIAGIERKGLEAEWGPNSIVE